jgi:REP element-mobilizing transposase RayT
MPRQVRIEYPGAIYHVMSRGNRRQNIYLDDVDRQDFLKTLAEACKRMVRSKLRRPTFFSRAIMARNQGRAACLVGPLGQVPNRFPLFY